MVASIEVEAQSRIVPQAFASRRAVVATNIGGIPELVAHEVNGLLVPPGDGAAISEAVRRLINDPALRNRLAEAGYQTALSRLSLDEMMRRTLEVYEKAKAG